MEKFRKVVIAVLSSALLLGFVGLFITPKSYAAICQVTFKSLGNTAKVGDILTPQATLINCKSSGQKAQIALLIDGQAEGKVSAFSTIDSDSLIVKWDGGVKVEKSGKYSFGLSITDNLGQTKPGLSFTDNGNFVSAVTTVQAPVGGPPAGGNPPPPDTSGDEVAVPDVENIQPPIEIDSVGQFFSVAIKYFFTIIAALAVFAIIIGGWQWVMSQGNEQMVTTGKKTIVWALFGLLIALSAFTIVTLILNALGATPPTK